MRIQDISNAVMKRNEKGQVLLLFAGCLVVLAAMVGVAVDAGRAFLVRAELAKALDAAVLGAGHSQEGGDQLAEIVRSRFRVNFPPTYLGIDRGGIVVDPISVSTDRDQNGFLVRIIRARAAAALPTTFLRVLGMTRVPVSSTAAIHRRFLDVVLALDRSGSIGEEGLEDLKQAARGFVRVFNTGVDRVGLLSFGGSITWGERLGTNPGFDRGRIEEAIDSMRLSDWTAGASALGEAYRELDRRWMDGHWRVIIFFTDGAPNTVRARFDFGPCRDESRTYPGSGGIITAAGAMLAGGEADNPSARNLVDGLFRPESPGDVPDYYEEYGFDARSRIDVGEPPEPGSCYDVRNRIERLPSIDFYGASLLPVRTPRLVSAREVVPDPRGDWREFRRSVNGMARNELENLAALARNDRHPNQGITIITIGLDGEERNLTRENEEWREKGEDILNRIANVPESGPYYHPEEPRGLFVLATRSEELQRAFQIVGTYILRLVE